VAGVEPDVGVTASQLPPLCVVALTVMLSGEGILETCNVAGCGTAPGDWYVKLRLPGVTVRLVGVVTVRTTATWVAVPPAGVMVNMPLYVPALRPPGFTLTDRLAGVVPDVGETESQLPPLAATVNETAEALEIESV